MLNNRSPSQAKHNTSLSEQSFFAAPTTCNQISEQEKQQAALLMAYVDKACYAEIERMWKECPRLMLVEVPVIGGQPNTPLKRALFRADTWTWRPYYEWLQQSCPDLLPEFHKQNREQVLSVDLSPLHQEYLAFYEMEEEWDQGDVDDAALDEQWRQFCQKQVALLPWHVLREMCREGKDLWRSSHDFIASAPPVGGRVFNFATKQYLDIDSDEFDKIFGTSTGVLRGNLEFACCSDQGHYGIHLDAAVIEMLMQARLAERASIVEWAPSDACVI